MPRCVCVLLEVVLVRVCWYADCFKVCCSLEGASQLQPVRNQRCEDGWKETLVAPQ